jgi:hypothetical protein
LDAANAFLPGFTENKHLSAALEHIKAKQDKAPPIKTPRRQAIDALSANRQTQQWLEFKAGETC